MSHQGEFPKDTSIIHAFQPCFPQHGGHKCIALGQHRKRASHLSDWSSYLFFCFMSPELVLKLCPCPHPPLSQAAFWASSQMFLGNSDSIRPGSSKCKVSGHLLRNLKKKHSSSYFLEQGHSQTNFLRRAENLATFCFRGEKKPHWNMEIKLCDTCNKARYSSQAFSSVLFKWVRHL